MAQFAQLQFLQFTNDDDGTPALVRKDMIINVRSHGTNLTKTVIVSLSGNRTTYSTAREDVHTIVNTLTKSLADKPTE